MLSAVISAS